MQLPCSLMLRMSILHGRITKEKVLVTIRILLSHAFPRPPTLKYPQLIVAFQNSTLALTKWSQISTCRPMWATHWEKMGGSIGFFGDSNSLCFSRVAGKHWWSKVRSTLGSWSTLFMVLRASRVNCLGVFSPVLNCLICLHGSGSKGGETCSPWFLCCQLGWLSRVGLNKI